MKHSLSRRAFTLVEILIATTLVGLLSASLLSFFVQALKAYTVDSEKLGVNRDIRSLTSQLTDHATYSNYFLIFPDFSTRTSGTGDASVNDGLWGDMLVLVFKDDADPTKISRLIGYYRSPDANNEGPLRRFEVKLETSSSEAAYTLLPALDTQGTHPPVAPLVKGIGGNKLFYNLYDRSVMVKGQLIRTLHASSAATTIIPRSASTYNFTVSPRG